MSLRTPPLSGVHEEAGASMTDFGGWEMPVEFESIREEHATVRSAVGKFDVSHMGEVTVDGPEAERLTQRLTTNDVAALDPGEAQYAAITDGDGVMLDDTVVYRLPAEADDEFLFVPNAGHDEEMAERWTSHREQWGLDATVTNRTTEYAMIALQGPDAPDLLAERTDIRLAEMDRFGVERGPVAGVDSLVARTGYTGERGFEILCPWDAAETVWTALECPPCGLGARDTLRLEMGFLLSGQDFDPEDEPRTPYEAGIGWTVKLDTEFVGRDALEQQDAEGITEKLVGIELVDRGIPRHGYEVQTPDGESIGHVTSGTMSPTLGEAIALAYLPVEYRDPGTSLRVVVRGEPKKARTRAPPFIDR
ncbi:MULTISPECIES: glycine cleavage system aminomethyltransferase GcvT [Haloarcula]|uniref:Probable aminomethyltransferase n=1 Tax=Haloarcula pellucida TaxID=1427151 RepID=A0A830GQU4_9EURY|nr:MULTISPECIES: glycine cleavage system aminomethyltransferase GcvT [Halomicroarcula]MBX0348136.1 glycine cleavage system aminomethyltransferase GcvT [Halomicroarcula pellucida]MDS0277980.1 glycine cleavage system aminomethyltransferase GcvT [Halomicroarcula sp. S1AR25-4]GGN97126.1 glycine cleavage system protein T [Halomicroarcula pellucida]